MCLSAEARLDADMGIKINLSVCPRTWLLHKLVQSGLHTVWGGEACCSSAGLVWGGKKSHDKR
jgi:hypothetical protein